MHTKHTYKTKDRLTRICGKTTIWVYCLWIWDLFLFGTKQTAGKSWWISYLPPVSHSYKYHITYTVYICLEYSMFILQYCFVSDINYSIRIYCYIYHLITHQTCLLYIFFKLFIFYGNQYGIIYKRVIVSVVTSSRFQATVRSKLEVSRSTSKDWLARNDDNVVDWSDMVYRDNFLTNLAEILLTNAIIFRRLSSKSSYIYVFLNFPLFTT